MKNPKKLVVLVFAALFGGGPLLLAQDPEKKDELDPSQLAELIRQIRRNMVEVEKNLDRVETEAGRKAAEEAKQNMDKLIEEMRARGKQITDDIDTFVKNLKQSGGGGGGSGSSDSQAQGNRGKARDRNQPENQGQSNPQGGQPQGGQREDNTARNPDGGNNRTSRPRTPEEEERINHQQIVEKWGNLPPELRQLLIERNFKVFMPADYQEELKAYFKRIASLK